MRKNTGIMRYYKFSPRTKAQHFQTKLVLKKKKRFSNDLERDLFAMNQVWRMLKEGAVRWVGEIARQY